VKRFTVIECVYGSSRFYLRQFAIAVRIPAADFAVVRPTIAAVRNTACVYAGFVTSKTSIVLPLRLRAYESITVSRF